MIISHWDHLVEELSTSSRDYYAALEEAIARRGIPGIKVSRQTWSEGGLLSAKREYLRIRRKDYVFDVCGAPFGTGFFFSWWLSERPSGILELLARIPVVGVIVGWIMQRLVKPATYYSLDTAFMFQKSVHAAVMEVIDSLTSQGGLKSLSDLERRPIMKEFFATS